MIYFRKANEPHNTATDSAVTHWHVECYSDTEGMMFPVGIAYVVEIQNRAAQLNFVFVADQWRRRGFGKDILRAVLQRWPQCQFTSGMDHLGAALLRSVGLIDNDEE